jgi:hypothetical protein
MMSMCVNCGEESYFHKYCIKCLNGKSSKDLTLNISVDCSECKSKQSRIAELEELLRKKEGEIDCLSKALKEIKELDWANAATNCSAYVAFIITAKALEGK